MDKKELAAPEQGDQQQNTTNNNTKVIFINSEYEYTTLKYLLSHKEMTTLDVKGGIAGVQVQSRIAGLRRKGFVIPCPRRKIKNQYGKYTQVGHYYLTDEDKPLARETVKMWERFHLENAE